MSDKGREAIKESLEGFMEDYLGHDTGREGEEADYIITHILRSHGWVHESDVVEGRVKCSNKDGHCTHASTSPNCQTCTQGGPATISDLIGRADIPGRGE